MSGECQNCEANRESCCYGTALQKAPIARHGFSSFRTPVQQHLSQHKIRRTGLSAHAPSSTNNDTLKIANVVRQIIRTQGGYVRKGKIIGIRN